MDRWTGWTAGLDDRFFLTEPVELLGCGYEIFDCDYSAAAGGALVWESGPGCFELSAVSLLLDPGDHPCAVRGGESQG